MRGLAKGEKMDPLKFALGFATFACIADDIEAECHAQKRAEELRDDLAVSGLDETDLYFMDGEERAEALESAGLDPFDYDDYDW